MKLEFVPLLRVQRELYDIPRGLTRFESYIETMTEGTDDMVLPLAAMNPMGKPHVAAKLDELIALGAEEVAAEAVRDAQKRLSQGKGEAFKVALVVADDLRGQWTNRYLTETAHRFDNRGEINRNWVVALCWTSEEPSRQKVRQQVLASIYRICYLQQYKTPKTLRQMMTQEGLAAFFAGAQEPSLDAEDLAYTREVIKPYLDATLFSSIFACLYGDEAAQSVGYEPIGLSARAGYAMALDEARQSRITPEAALLG